MFPYSTANWPIPHLLQALDELQSVRIAVVKLRDELDAFRPDRYDEETVTAVEEKIRMTLHPLLEEPFLWPRWVKRGGIRLRPGGRSRNPQYTFWAKVEKTRSLMNHLIEQIGIRRAVLVAAMRHSFASLNLHPRIVAAAAKLFLDGHYRNAVLDASLALIQYVKEKSQCHTRDGADLVRYVISRNDPILAFNALADESDRNEQEGFMHLFEGVVLALRNPRAHRFYDDSPVEALEYLGLLSLLAKRLDVAQRCREP